MNKAQGAVATGESEETDVKNVEPTLLGSVLSEMGVAPKVVKSEETKPDPETTETEAETTEEPTESEEPEVAAEATEPEEETEESEPETEGVPEGQDVKAEKVKEDWPEDARARVIEEANKRRKRTEERDTALQTAEQAKQAALYWKAQAEQLNQQIQTRPITPTEADPLADVQDGRTLNQAVKQYEELLEFSRLHPDGVEDLLLGRDAQGNEIRQTYTKEQCAKMGVDAEKVLRRFVPLKANQLQQQAVMAEEARKVYPEMWSNPETNRDVNNILAQLPELRRYPDYLIGIGDMIMGRNLRLSKSNGSKESANGNGVKPLSKSAKAILSQPKVKPAPGIAKSRSMGSIEQTSNSEIEAAKKEMQEKNTDEAMEKFVGTLLKKGRIQEEALV